MTNPLHAIAKQLVANGRGILAADESVRTAGKRLHALGLENADDNRRAMRDMLLTAPGLEDYISGVILYDETFNQNAVDGRPFLNILGEKGILPGIKVDEGLMDMDGHPDQKITIGLRGLPERLEDYAAKGAKFAKWRAVFTILDQLLPERACIQENARALAHYAKYCQRAGIVPIVEPEILMDGEHNTHGIARCYEVTEEVLHAVFDHLRQQKVDMAGILLKPSMVIPGKESEEKAGVDQVADNTLRVLNATVPHEVPGIVFLSGGQEDIEATEHLQKMNELAGGNAPWALSFSYGRALQAAALKAWAGENKEAGQAALLHRARMNWLAAKGKYSDKEENAA